MVILYNTVIMDISNLCDRHHASTSRAGNTARNSRKKKILDKDHIEADLTESKCAVKCKRKCEETFNTPAGVQTIMEWRQKYHNLRQGFPKQMKLIELFKASRIKEGNNTMHVVEGTYVCRQFWFSTVMKISRATYFRCIQMVNAGVQLEKHALKRGKSNFKGRIAIGFMRSYIRRMGDPSPETERILMPLCVTKRSMYEEYKKQENDCIGLKRFYQLFKCNFRHVSFPKCLKNSITGCDICMLARDLISSAPSDDIKQALIKDRDNHLNKQQVERNFYYERRAEAIAQPKQKCSLIIDGMDQSKTDLPHYKGWKKPKSANKGRLRTHVMGVILHGQKTHFYLDLLQWPHDANLVLNCILNTLYTTYKEEKKLPPTLYIQMDNCGRENKNRYIIGFFSLMVQKGLVNEVVLGFLMQGHTHEDIDQRFSKVSHILKRRDARTLPELRDVLLGCLLYSSSDVTVLGRLFDIKTWMSDCVPEIHNHSHPHLFRITKQNEIATLYYKMWSTDELWQPEGGLEILRRAEDGTPNTPEGCPPFVNESFDKQNFEEIKKGLAAQKHQMNYTQWSWWEIFLENYSIQDISKHPFWWLPNFLLQEDQGQEHQDAEFMSPLSLLVSKQNVCPPVYAGKKATNTRQRVKKTKKKISYQPCVGVMIAFESKIKKGDAKVGKIVAVTDSDMMVHLYEGNLKAILKAAVKPDGSDKLLKISRQRLIYTFQLTGSKKIPALAMKRINEHFQK